MSTIQNPMVPFNLPIPGGMSVGKMVTVQGNVPSMSNRFAVNLLCHSGDIALHVSPNFGQNCVIRNNVKSMQWGPEERSGSLPFYPGQNFEIIILCEQYDFKIAVNGRHFTEFNHRLPFHTISNVAVDGDVVVHNVHFTESHNQYGNNNVPSSQPYGFAAGPGPFPNSAGPYPPNPGPPYNNSPSPYPSTGSHMPQGSGGYPQQPNYGQVPHQGLYPQMPGTNSRGHSPTPSSKPGFLDQAGAALAGVLGPGLIAKGMRRGTDGTDQTRSGTRSDFLGQAAGTLAGLFTGAGLSGLNHHGRNNHLGVLGTTIAGAALTGHLNPIKAAKKQKKAQKKALKYGLPIAGVGLGAYALHKGLKKGFGRSSSSSSCSSSD